MTPGALIFSALLLGAFVLLAGLYGLFYSIGVLHGGRHLLTAAYGCWVLQFLVALSIVMLTPLGSGWKILIVASCLVYLRIPPIAWRHLQRLHNLHEGGRLTVP